MMIGSAAIGNVVMRRSTQQQRSTGETIDWRLRGACRGLDAAIFYPDDDDDAEQAKFVCHGCAVRVACLEYALLKREKAGVWGGSTERERRRIIRQRRRSA